MVFLVTTHALRSFEQNASSNYFLLKSFRDQMSYLFLHFPPACFLLLFTQRFEKYQHTFPEHERDSVGNLRLQSHGVARQWGKHKTVRLPHGYILNILHRFCKTSPLGSNAIFKNIVQVFHLKQAHHHQRCMDKFVVVVFS